MTALDATPAELRSTAPQGIQWPAVSMLVWREIVRFVRQRSRLIGTFSQPLVFWLLLGGGLNASFRPPGAVEGVSYFAYFFPGSVALVLLFTAVFATIAVVEDRQGGFLQGVLVAPVSRASIVLGQSLGCTLLALGQGVLFLLLGPTAGVTLTAGGFAAALGVQFLIAFGMTNLGLAIAWRTDSTQGFHAMMNLILLPLWILSGAFFPVSGASVVLQWVMWVNPLTYGMALLRHALDLASPALAGALPPVGASLVVVLLFCAASFGIAVRTARRSGV